jgi:hypothetical protein
LANAAEIFYFPCLLLTTIRRCGLPKIFENGRKKSSKSFSDLLLHVPLRGGGIFSFYVIGQAET